MHLLKLSPHETLLLSCSSPVLAVALCDLADGSSDLKVFGDAPEAWALLLEFLNQHACEKTSQMNADHVSLLLPLSHKYHVHVVLEECLGWCGSFTPSPLPDHPHSLEKWLQVFESLQLDTQFQRLQQRFYEWDLSSVATSPTYVLRWTAAAEKHAWQWMLDHCLSFFTPLPPSVPMPGPVYRRHNAQKVEALLRVLSDEQGCSLISLPTLLQLSRSQLPLLQRVTHAEVPCLVASCQNGSCDAQLAVWRGNEGSRASEAVMCRPSLGRALVQKEAQALGSDVRCACGGRFCVEGSRGCSERRCVRLG